jgi:hypothetical protein
MFRDHRAPVWVIWGLVVLFGVVQAAAWTVAGGIPTRPVVLVQVFTAWIVILVLAVLEVLVGIFAWRGSGFARFAGTLYALIFGIPLLLIALAGPSSRSVDGVTTNTTAGFAFVLVFAIGYLFTAFAFIFRWRSGQAR